ncbi:MAG: bifunctional lysylphosphatidylglycerol flippase/synthetase MprF [Alphaproteobacteria bacterium]
MPDHTASISALTPKNPSQSVGKYKTKARTVIMVAAGLLMFAAALVFIRHELQAHSFKKIVTSMKSIPPLSIMWAVLATTVSFASISLYDYLALRYTDKAMPFRRTGFASFCAYAISNTLGMGALTGNAVRLRLYSSWGLGALDVAVIAFITALFLFASGLSLAAFGLLTDSLLFESVFHLPFGITIVLGVIAAAIVAVCLSFLLTGPEVRTFRKVTIKRPARKLVFAQWFAGIVDWVAAAAVLYILLPGSPEFSFLTFVPIYVAAHYIGSLSGLPGGIGVFEAVFLLLIPSGNELAVAAGLVAYRAVYYLLPLIIAVIGLTLHQAYRSRSAFKKGGEQAADFMESLAPIAFSVLTFITGAVMLLSAATPGLMRHMDFAAKVVPYSVIELSHLLASAVGTLLLLVAMGLRRRLRNAWGLAIVLFSAGAMLTFFKGGDPRGAVLMLGLAACLILSKDAFYRKGTLRHMRLTWPRFGVILGSAALALWSGFYAYKHKAYSSELWWDFTLQDDASRFLRAMAFMGAILLIYFAWRLLQPAPKIEKPHNSKDTLDKVRSIIGAAQGARTEANLALLGDKQFLFSDSGNSFIMYGVRGRNWVAMGEPVGLESERRELMWKFRQTADIWDAWPSFYSVRGDNLNDFVDLGLTVQKIGEMALVPIKDYTLEGPSKSRFRQARNRAIRDGCSFEVIYPAANSSEMDNLEAVSNDWLHQHQGKEKGFSLGSFDREVFSQQPIAVARKDGKIVAFANLWMTTDKTEMSLDLMRYTNVGVGGLMDFLFAELMLWGSAQGYSHLSLGMAPLSGLEAHRLAPLMTRLGALVFKYGGRFYGFEGLRAFKEKFNPEWIPVYLAAPSQLVMPAALGNLALLSGGGVLGLLQRDG